MVPNRPETNRTLLVKNPTGLIINVFRQLSKDIDPGPGEGRARIDPLDQIYPNETLNIEINTELPHTYFFASGKRILWNRELDRNRVIVDKLDYNPETSNINQYEIKLRSLDPSTPVPLNINNVSFMELSIERVAPRTIFDLDAF